MAQAVKCWPRFNPRPLHVGSVVDKWHRDRFLWVRRLYPVSISPSTLHAHSSATMLYNWRCRHKTFKTLHYVNIKYWQVCRWLSRYSDWLRAGRYGDRRPVGARFSTSVQTGPGAHPATCTIGTRSFPGLKRPGRGADHPHLLAPRSRMSRTIPLLPLWALGGLL
jgi:hypothetical protein